MLRKIRITLALIFFVGITLLFLDFTGTVHAWLGWMAKVQFLPVVLALNVGGILLLAVLTLIFGRVYCSVICPLGVMQDIVSWISGKRKKKKYRFTYSAEKKWLRYGMLGVFVIAIIAGIGSFVALLAPYSSYGVSPPTCSRRYTNGATTCWPTSQNGQRVMPFMKQRCG